MRKTKSIAHKLTQEERFKAKALAAKKPAAKASPKKMKMSAEPKQVKAKTKPKSAAKPKANAKAKTPSKPQSKLQSKTRPSEKPVAKSSAKSLPNEARFNDSGKMDIIQMILEDHKPLKQLIKILKNSEDHGLEKRQEAFEEFAPLLICHAKPEEQSLYVFMKMAADLREGGFEGDVEHILADQLVEEIRRTDDEDLWSARVKVLAELVEHHIKEEEEELFPKVRKNSDAEDRSIMAKEYAVLRRQMIEKGGKDSPSEVTMESSIAH